MDERGTVFNPVDFPRTKEDIENAVLAAALGVERPLDIRTFYGLTADPERLPEAHFEFKLHTRTGIKYLDLMEVAILKESGGSYERVVPHHNLGQRGDAVYAELKKKSDRYGKAPRTPIHLLLYATDYKFDLTGSGGDLLAHQLNRRELCFATVLYTRLFPGNQAANRILFPLSKSELRALESERMLRGITELIFDPRQQIVRLTKEEEGRVRSARPKQADGGQPRTQGDE